MAETADSNIGSQENPINIHDTNLQRSVVDKEELLIPLEPREIGESEIDIESIVESQLLSQTEEFIRAKTSDRILILKFRVEPYVFL